MLTCGAKIRVGDVPSVGTDERDAIKDTPYTPPPPRSQTARLTGLAYLGIVVSGIFAEFFVRMSLVVPDDPAATASNIAGAPGLCAPASPPTS